MVVLLLPMDLQVELAVVVVLLLLVVAAAAAVTKMQAVTWVVVLSGQQVCWA